MGQQSAQYNAKTGIGSLKLKENALYSKFGAFRCRKAFKFNFTQRIIIMVFMLKHTNHVMGNVKSKL